MRFGFVARVLVVGMLAGCGTGDGTNSSLNPTGNFALTGAVATTFQMHDVFCVQTEQGGKQILAVTFNTLSYPKLVATVDGVTTPRVYQLLGDIVAVALNTDASTSFASTATVNLTSFVSGQHAAGTIAVTGGTLINPTNSSQVVTMQPSSLPFSCSCISSAANYLCLPQAL